MAILTSDCLVLHFLTMLLLETVFKCSIKTRCQRGSDLVSSHTRPSHGIEPQDYSNSTTSPVMFILFHIIYILQKRICYFSKAFGYYCNNCVTILSMKLNAVGADN